MEKILELLISRPFEPRLIRRTIYAMFIALITFCLFVIVFESVSGRVFFHKEGASIPLLQTLIVGSSILAIIAFSQEWTSKEKYRKDLGATLTNLFRAYKYQDRYVAGRDLLRVFRELREIVKNADIPKAKESLIDRALQQAKTFQQSNFASDSAELNHLNFLITIIDALGLDVATDEQRESFLSLRFPAVTQDADQPTSGKR